MKIVTCYKLVPEEDSIRIAPDRKLDLSAAEWKIGQYDLNAIEAGVALAQAGDTVTALTCGGEIVENSKLRKGVLSRGPAEIAAVKDEQIPGADCFAVADVLRKAIEKIGEVDLVICGEGSGDIYSQQTGSMTGALLGWTTVNAVSAIERVDEKTLNVERTLEGSIEVLQIQLPAVLSVTAGINKPRIPGMREIMAAGKKPAAVWTAEDVAAAVNMATETISLLAPEAAGRQNQVLGEATDENLDTLAGIIRKAI